MDSPIDADGAVLSSMLNFYLCGLQSGGIIFHMLVLPLQAKHLIVKQSASIRSD